MTKNQGIINVDGFELRYVIHGNGQAAIVIGSSLYYPRTFSQNLYSHLRMIFMDHRGFGKALRPFINASFELDNIVDDIETLRQELNLNKIILIGHSGHGHMVLEYAKKYPNHVSHIILLAMSPNSSPESFAAADHYFQQFADAKRKELLGQNLATLDTAIEANPRKAFIIRMLKFGPMIWYKPDYDAAWLWQDVEVIPEMFDYVWGKVFLEIDIVSGLEKIACPVFLGLGRYDFWNPPHLWDPIQSKFNNLTLRIFEKSGHTPQLEEPDAFNEEILSWLNKSL